VAGIKVTGEEAVQQNRRRESGREVRLPGRLRFDRRPFLTFPNGEQFTRTLRAKSNVYSQGDPADAVHYIEAGRIQITVVSKYGKEAVIAMLEPGEFFGEGCISGEPLRMASASTTAKSTVIRLDKSAMIRALHDQPAFARMFMDFLVARKTQLEADLVDHLFNSSEQRLARLLLLLGNFGEEGKLQSLVPKVSQAALAARVGTTRSRINFFMNKFRKLGLIEYGADGLKVHPSLLNIIVNE
jgi:CRP/FNR family transcriptional regulator, cyclic AMP receptor protein